MQLPDSHAPAGGQALTAESRRLAYSSGFRFRVPEPHPRLRRWCTLLCLPLWLVCEGVVLLRDAWLICSQRGHGRKGG